MDAHQVGKSSLIMNAPIMYVNVLKDLQRMLMETVCVAMESLKDQKCVMMITLMIVSFN